MRYLNRTYRVLPTRVAIILVQHAGPLYNLVMSKELDVYLPASGQVAVVIWEAAPPRERPTIDDILYEWEHVIAWHITGDLNEPVLVKLRKREGFYQAT